MKKEGKKKDKGEYEVKEEGEEDEVSELDESDSPDTSNPDEDENKEAVYKSILGSNEIDPNTSNPEGLVSKDSVYKSIIEKNTKMKDRVEEVAKYIYQFDKMFFYFSEEGRGTWIERHYPEVKSKKKMIIKRVDQLYNQDLKN
jgi:hypothetical protein